MKCRFVLMLLALLTLCADAITIQPRTKVAFTRDGQIFVSGDTLSLDSYVNSLTVDSEGGASEAQAWSHEDYHWLHNIGGRGSRQLLQISDDWNSSGWLWGSTNRTSAFLVWAPNLSGTEIDVNNDGSSVTNSIILPYLTSEYCLVNDPRSTVGTPQCLGQDYWVTNWYTDQYLRYSQVKCRLETGGQPGSRSRSLWQFNVTATAILDKRAQRPFSDVTSQPIAPQNITILGHTLNPDGSLWVSLPDGTNFDITPVIPGVDFYTFDITQQKYSPYLVANEAGLDENTAEFCVGEKVVLSLRFDPPLPQWQAQVTGTQWAVSPGFVNAYEQFIPSPGSPHVGDFFTITCDPVSTNWSRSQGSDLPDAPYARNYLSLAPPPTQPETGLWWVSDGPKRMSCLSTLTLTNGQSLSLSVRGGVSVFAPAVTNFITVNPTFPNSARSFLWDGTRLSYGNSATGEHGMYWAATVNSKFDGTLAISQLANALYSQNYGQGSGGVNPVNTGGNLWLDGPSETVVQSAYSAAGPGTHSIALASTPSLSLSSNAPVNVRLWGKFNDYLRFKPAGPGSIYITLATNSWSMEGFATVAGGLVTNTVPAPNPAIPNSAFPFWINVKTP